MMEYNSSGITLTSHDLPSMCSECEIVYLGEHDDKKHDLVVYDKLQRKFEEFFTMYPSDQDIRNKIRVVE